MNEDRLRACETRKGPKHNCPYVLGLRVLSELYQKHCIPVPCRWNLLGVMPRESIQPQKPLHLGCKELANANLRMRPF